jgi:hypothetical protein
MTAEELLPGGIELAVDVLEGGVDAEGIALPEVDENALVRGAAGSVEPGDRDR